MEPITVRLMNTPSVTLGDAPVCFPYRKAEGFFYYLCVRKSVTREEAVSVFWAANDEKAAKKNLRDVIYKIRRLLGEDVLLVAGNSTVRLNPQRGVSIDLDELSPDNIVHSYPGDFLNYFYIKNCLEFEKWSEEIRDHFRSMYLAALEKNLSSLAESRDIAQIKKHAAALIQNDLYNEDTYRRLMRLYMENGQYNLAIKLYYELKEVLHEDLEEEPEEETNKLFAAILALKESYQRQNKDEAPFFYGRYQEVYHVLEVLKAFAQGAGRSIVISGEAGVGKTTLLNRVRGLMDEERFLILSHSCQYAEKDLYLSIWYDMIRQISGRAEESRSFTTQEEEALSACVYTPDQAAEEINSLRSEVITETLMRLGRQNKLILLLDDIQWMDSASLLLISNLLTELGGERVMMIASYREDYERQVSRFLIPLLLQERAEQIRLQRFSPEETREMVSQLLPEGVNSPDLARRIYHDTEGIPLFIVELAQIIKDKGDYGERLSEKAANIIKSRLLDLSQAEQELLDAISLFEQRVSMSGLKIFYPMVELEIFELLEGLIDKRLIREESDRGDIYYSFTHQQLRDFAYQRQSAGKRRLLHGKIAAHYEERLAASHDMSLYPQLIFHCQASGDGFRAACYRVDYAEKFYYVSHEIYPNMLGQAGRESLSRDGLDERGSLIQLAADIDRLDPADENNLRLRMRVQFVLGRYYIHACEYPSALRAIDMSLTLARRFQDDQYLLANHKQLIYYAIQVSDLTVMRKNLDACQAILPRLPENKIELSQLTRLEGLYAIKTGDLPAAQSILSSAIALIEEDSTQPAMNLAVCYNYLGNTYLHLGHDEIALSHYDKAIQVCDKRFLTSGLGVFYANASQALFHMGRYEQARPYIAQAIQCFETTHTLWGRANAEICAAQIEAKTGHPQEAREFAQKARNSAQRLDNPELIRQIEKMSGELEVQ